MAEIEFDHVSKEFPDGTLAVDALHLTVEDGEFMIFVGPSGCGKTTALRMVAGLETITSGDIRIGGRRVNGVDPSDRDIAMVFQNYALYPHMNVRDNIGFPLRMRNLKKRAVSAQVEPTAEMLGIDAFLERKPGELSGGQRQRVAMGRAVVRQPQAFLMDEPLSNLDAKLRVQMRAELVKLHARLGVTTIYVTHDQTEAMTLGHRVAVMSRGVMQQVDTPQRLYRNPANVFVASFVGSPTMNFVHARLEGSMLTAGPLRLLLPREVEARLLSRPGTVLLGIRPEAFSVGAPGPRPTVRANVEVVEELGPEIYAYVRVPGMSTHEVGERTVELAGAVTTRLDASVFVEPGDEIELAIDPEGIHLFDTETRDSILAPAVLRSVRAALAAPGSGGEQEFR